MHGFPRLSCHVHSVAATEYGSKFAAVVLRADGWLPILAPTQGQCADRPPKQPVYTWPLGWRWPTPVLLDFVSGYCDTHNRVVADAGIALDISKREVVPDRLVFPVLHALLNIVDSLQSGGHAGHPDPLTVHTTSASRWSKQL